MLNKIFYYLFLFSVSIVACTKPAIEQTPIQHAVKTNQYSTPNAHSILKKAVQKTGHKKFFYQKGDVQLMLTYHHLLSDKREISIERYKLDKELSWGDYIERDLFTMPKVEGNITQGYDGAKAWILNDEKLVTNDNALQDALIMRKINYFWFTMIYKLLDDEIIHQYKGLKHEENKDFHLIQMTFENEGSEGDTLIAYINNIDFTIEKILMSAKKLGFQSPILMNLEYENINGMWLATKRRFAPANWKGEVIKEDWITITYENIMFDNFFGKAQFSIPQYLRS